jgi:hypothetical protein
MRLLNGLAPAADICSILELHPDFFCSQFLNKNHRLID